MRLIAITVLAIVVLAGSVIVAGRAGQDAIVNSSRERALVADLASDTNRLEAITHSYALTGDRALASEYASVLRGQQTAVQETIVLMLGNGDAAQRRTLKATLSARRALTALLPTTLDGSDPRGRQSVLRDRAGRIHALSAGVVRRFATLQAQTGARFDRDRAHAARVGPTLVVVLGLLITALAGVIQFRAKRDRQRRRRQRVQMERLGEAMEVSTSQTEAQELIKRHLEQSLPGATVTVLNRNNSADRLEAATALAEDSTLAGALEHARPRSCMAVRLSRTFSRTEGSDEMLTCDLCGALPSESTCQPLLVGGEVIGAVLAEHEQTPDADDIERISRSVARAAPVLANLRNLAIAETRASTDVLTGLPNRRAADDTLRRMLAQAGRDVEPMSVIALDLDHFKQINDTYGHDRGDEVLAAVSTRMREALRASDFAGRNGGEEFVMVLADTDRAGAALVAERLRRELHGLALPGVDRSITASFGIACFPEDAVEVETLMRCADRALYAAKRNGRDRIETTAANDRPGPLDPASEGPEPDELEAIAGLTRRD